MFLFFIYALSVQLANGQTVSYTPPNPSFPIGVKTIAVNGFGTSSAISDLASVCLYLCRAPQCLFVHVLCNLGRGNAAAPQFTGPP